MVTVTQILLLMVRNKATYDKLIPAVQHTFAIYSTASNAPMEEFLAMGALCYS